jgi:N-acylneuraminate cytidylyltransferase
MRVAVIPARGGSKRIPRKNVKLFCGRPMIAWSIEAALNSSCFDQVVVSTDDEEIATISVKHGASVPFLRPKTLSDDHTGTIPVIQHTIESLQLSSLDIEHVCCIYATAPFIQPSDIRRGLHILLDKKCSYAFSVTRYPFPIQRAVKITGENRVEMFYPDFFSVRSQDLEEAFHDAGQFYWGTARAWLEGQQIFGHGAAPVLLPRHRVQDIDTDEDWQYAEWMFKAMTLERK